MNAARLVEHFDRISEAPDAVPRLRQLLLRLATKGRLVPQNSDDVSSSDDLQSARNGLAARAAGTTRLRWRPSDPISPKDVPVEKPTGWIFARLNDTGLYVNGLPFKPSDWNDDGLPIIRIQNLSDLNKPFNYARGDFADEVIVRNGDILVSWSATLDAFVWNRGPGVLNQHIFRVVPATELVDTRFLTLLLKQAIRDLAESEHAHGLVMSHINRGPFLAHVVAIPPRPEQHRIVARVDELMALCDRLETAQAERERRRSLLTTSSLRRINEPAENVAFREGARFHVEHFSQLTTTPDKISSLRETVLNLAVRGQLVPQDSKEEGAAELLRRLRTDRAKFVRDGGGPSKRAATGRLFVASPEQPPQWTTVKLGDVCDLVTSGSRGWAEFYSKTGPKFIRAQNIRFGRLRLDELACVRPPRGAEGARTQVSVGDLLIVITGAGVTNPALLDQDLGEAYVSQHVALVRPTATVLSRWILLSLMAPAAGRGQLVERAYGAGKPGLNLDSIRSLALPLPPLGEQTRILAKVSQLMAMCDGLEAQLSAAQTKSRQLLEAILSDALSTDGTLAS